MKSQLGNLIFLRRIRLEYNLTQNRIKYTREEDKLLNNYAEWLFKIFRKKCHRQMGKKAMGFNLNLIFFLFWVKNGHFGQKS